MVCTKVNSQIGNHAAKISTEQRFLDFHEQHPQVYDLFTQFALQLIRRGHRKLGAKMIIERIRWERYTGSEDAFGWKLNNNYSAYYARLFMQDHPQYAGIFELRSIRNDG